MLQSSTAQRLMPYWKMVSSWAMGFSEASNLLARSYTVLLEEVDKGGHLYRQDYPPVMIRRLPIDSHSDTPSCERITTVLLMIFWFCFLGFG